MLHLAISWQLRVNHLLGYWCRSVRQDWWLAEGAYRQICGCLWPMSKSVWKTIPACPSDSFGACPWNDRKICQRICLSGFWFESFFFRLTFAGMASITVRLECSTEGKLLSMWLPQTIHFSLPAISTVNISKLLWISFHSCWMIKCACLTKNRYSAATIILLIASFNGLIGSLAAPKYGHFMEFKTDSKSLETYQENQNRSRASNVTFQLTWKISPSAHHTNRWPYDRRTISNCVLRYFPADRWCCSPNPIHRTTINTNCSPSDHLCFSHKLSGSYWKSDRR